MQIGVQRSFTAHGAKGECGWVSFEPNSRTVSVPVSFKTIFMGIGQMQTGDSFDSFFCTCANEVVDGRVTFTRHGGVYNDGSKMNFVMYGW